MPTMKRPPLLLGAHMSIAGGLYRAVERARQVGCDCVQIFTTPPRGWGLPATTAAPAGASAARQAAARATGEPRAEPLPVDAVRRFQETLGDLRVVAPISHTTYLINVASPDPELWEKSLASLVAEVLRCGQLGVPNVVLHPGAAMTATEEAGLQRAVEGLREVERQTRGVPVRILLESTAGQGTQLGHRLEHLATLLDALQDEQRFGVCLDTCHLFAAGYALTKPADYRKTMKQVDELIGAAHVHAIHVNDSKQPLGSRRDRHDHIGRGLLGLDAFRNLVNDTRWARVPMYLETPEGKDGDEDWHAVNLRTLRELHD